MTLDDQGFQPESFSQAIAGAAAIRHNCNSRKRRREGSGGPLYVVRTDGIRWQCGRVEERISQCPRVLLGGVIKLRFSAGGWPVNLWEVVNRLGKVFRECLMASPRAMDESVVSGGRSSSTKGT